MLETIKIILFYSILFYALPCSALVDNIRDEEVALIGACGKLGYGRVTGLLGHSLGPDCGS